MALVCLVEKRALELLEPDRLLRAQGSGTSVSLTRFSYHPIVRNPAKNWIIEKKAAPMIHIHLESRISRWYDQINRKKNKAEAEIQAV
jgi:hypothetical protein